MKVEEALEKLELEIGASQKEIKQQYQEFYNEFQLRITNAPTTHQKTLYQKKLKELEEAYDLLTGQKTDTLDSDIPWASPGKAIPESPQGKQPEPPKETLTKTKALSLIGLKYPFTEAELEKAFETKKSDCEKGIKEASLASIKEAYKSALQEIIAAYQLLIPLAEADLKEPIHKVKENPKQDITKGHDKNDNRKPTKKKSLLTPIVLSTIILAVILLIWKPWEPSIDPAVERQFTAIKANANFLAEEFRWEEALEKYESANKLMEDKAVLDSIQSITTRLERMAIAEEVKDWEEVQQTNTIAAYNTYLNEYPNGRYKIQCENAVQLIKDKIKQANEIATKKEAEARAKQQIEADRIKMEKQKQEDAIASAELKAWNTAKEKDTQNSYKKYMDEYPNGIFIGEAYSKFKKAKYKYIYDYNKGWEYTIAGIDDKYGIIDKDRKVLLPVEYYDIRESATTGIFYYKKYSNSNWGILDKDGKNITQAIYEHVIGSLNEPNSKRAWIGVKLNGKYGFIDNKGKTRLPFIYDEVCIQGFIKGIILVKKGKKIGLINYLGEEITGFIYDGDYSVNSGYGSDGIWNVKQNGEKFWINNKGEKVED
ncbi:WG repeat-containing protein [Tamlana flava]|uniref:WG repeat-containing protein n=1 Tax=Tamlana flava TaxID=3158572 RepID=UPI00351B0662